MTFPKWSDRHEDAVTLRSYMAPGVGYSLYPLTCLAPMRTVRVVRALDVLMANGEVTDHWTDGSENKGHPRRVYTRQAS